MYILLFNWWWLYCMRTLFIISTALLAFRLPDSQCHHCPDRRWTERKSIWSGRKRGETYRPPRKSHHSWIPKSLVLIHFVWHIAERCLLWVKAVQVHHHVSLHSLVYIQASRARQLGATVYCVGVKDFNETQVTQASTNKPQWMNCWSVNQNFNPIIKYSVACHNSFQP